MAQTKSTMKTYALIYTDTFLSWVDCYLGQYMAFIYKPSHFPVSLMVSKQLQEYTE